MTSIVKNKTNLDSRNCMHVQDRDFAAIHMGHKMMGRGVTERSVYKKWVTEGHHFRVKHVGVDRKFKAAKTSNRVFQVSSVEDTFNGLMIKWKNETKGLSQAASKINNKNYLTIIGLGVSYPDIIIKLILQDLSQESSYWHYALKKITQINPVPIGLAASIRETSKYWLEWGRANSKI